MGGLPWVPREPGPSPGTGAVGAPVVSPGPPVPGSAGAPVDSPGVGAVGAGAEGLGIDGALGLPGIAGELLPGAGWLCALPGPAPATRTTMKLTVRTAIRLGSSKVMGVSFPLGPVGSARALMMASGPFMPPAAMSVDPP